MKGKMVLGEFVYGIEGESDEEKEMVDGKCLFSTISKSPMTEKAHNSESL